MASWTDFDVNNLLPGEPFTSAIALGFEENPRALAEQATGAPKIADKTVIGAGTVTISGLDEFGGLWIRGQTVNSGSGSATASPSFSYSTDNGSTFSSTSSLGSISVSTTPGNAIRVFASGEVFIDFASGGYKSILSAIGVPEDTDSDTTTGTKSGLGLDVTDIRIFGFNVLFANPQGGESAA